MDMVACFSPPPLLLEVGDLLSWPDPCVSVPTASGEVLEPALLSEHRFRLPEANLAAAAAPAEQ